MTEYLSISALTKYIKVKFERDPYLENVYIKGELSNVKHHSSGHLYFALKDGGAVLNGMMFKRDAVKTTFTPKEGDQVLITGRVSVYEARGSYQLYVNEMSLDGVGQLYERFEALKKELEAKGWFNAAHKKKLSRYPQRIAVLTASTGAAIRDIESTLTRRYPLADVHYISTLVQGAGAVEDIVKNIKQADTLGVDVMIVGRGGGSIEDLWAFNERAVVQAIYEAETPIISAVGHETDTTLSDFAADLRAPTPTAAAVMATPDQSELMNQLKSTDVFLRQQLTQRLKYEQQRVQRLSSHPVFRNPDLLIEQQVQRKDELEQKMFYLLKDKFAGAKERFVRLDSRLSGDRLQSHIALSQQQLSQYARQLDQSVNRQHESLARALEFQQKLLASLNPTGILDRGYSIVRTAAGITSSIHDLEVSQTIDIQMADGEISAVVEVVKED
ncbi:exodeoxyribonuclease VII large subunit [Macrococcus equipercicus]|uniref:Exodeoxyribonuclease 7 large subunit n=1 Tax=Macrococcus equipercicus TaxID=69967 RepID=A0A9Q9F0L4_9STAP|nr:exodeoxyribonuclease VII large subunit [Macrococcus equipercicus]KAA1040127.1 exodeoxyribonuclease VII large subunit [Macrococcus equipercicus]UTH12925.1 exodeoxyribonuclease VII large subunit [Macrococcus equipercicus]